MTTLAKLEVISRMLQCCPGGGCYLHGLKIGKHLPSSMKNLRPDLKHVYYEGLGSLTMSITDLTDQHGYDIYIYLYILYSST